MGYENILVNGVLFRFIHPKQHQPSKLDISFVCGCGAPLKVSCPGCDSDSTDREPPHTSCAFQQSRSAMQSSAEYVVTEVNGYKVLIPK